MCERVCRRKPEARGEYLSQLLSIVFETESLI